MANNVNTIAYLGGAFMYVYILQAPVIKRCKRYKGTLYRCHKVIHTGTLSIKR